MNEMRPVPVAPDHVCRCFDRVPESLIEEPEVCEFCRSYAGGFCVNPDTQKGKPPV